MRNDIMFRLSFPLLSDIISEELLSRTKLNVGLSLVSKSISIFGKAIVSRILVRLRPDVVK